MFYNNFSVAVYTTDCIQAYKFFDFSNWFGRVPALHVAPKEKSLGVISGERGGQVVGPSLLIYRSGNFSPKESRIEVS